MTRALVHRSSIAWLVTMDASVNFDDPSNVPSAVVMVVYAPNDADAIAQFETACRMVPLDRHEYNPPQAVAFNPGTLYIL